MSLHHNQGAICPQEDAVPDFDAHCLGWPIVRLGSSRYCTPGDHYLQEEDSIHGDLRAGFSDGASLSCGSVA